MEEQEEEEKRERHLKYLQRDQTKEILQAEADFRASLQEIMQKYKIVVKFEDLLPFKHIMMIKNQEDGFFFEYKKKRTLYLKPCEVEKKESVLEKFQRKAKEERNEKLRK